MSHRRCDAEDYIQFLLASPRVFTCTEAARVHPDSPSAPGHDAFNRLLDRLEPDALALWADVKSLVDPRRGVLIIDDTTLDKPYARHIDLVTRHWSGKHRAVVQGINLVTLVWHDGDSVVPCDYRIYHKSADGLTKNDHFVAMLAEAKSRGFRPEIVLFDSWYASLENLKRVRDCGWHWLTQLKTNRVVNLGDCYAQVGDLDIPAHGLSVHLKGYGQVRLFRLVATNGDTQYWATNQLTMTAAEWEWRRGRSWAVELYHRGLKQFTGVERGQMRAARKQRNHIGCAVRAFVRLAAHCLRRGVSWFEAKHRIVRDAVRHYLSSPTMVLETATA